MQVLNIGNVVSCNHRCIFINNTGTPEAIPATIELLTRIKDTASNNCTFYKRMYEELVEEYEMRKVEAQKKYHYISNEMVQDAYRRSALEGISLKCHQNTNNEEYVRQYGILWGIFEGATFAGKRNREFTVLRNQAIEGLRVFNK